jgi:hypothetical protein
MNLSDEIWLPANILLPDAPGSDTAEIQLRIRVKLPAGADTARKVTIRELLEQADLVDYTGKPYPGLLRPAAPGAVGGR